MEGEFAELPWLEKGWREECGVFGVYGPGLDVSRLTYYGLYALQHRGQESAGIAVSDGRQLRGYKGMGLVPEVFGEEKLRELQGNSAIGHVRYSTTGASTLVNAQPLVFHTSNGMVAVAHNGNLTNAAELRRSLGAGGSIFQSTTDSEVIINLMARHQGLPPAEALLACMPELRGAYSLVLLTERQLIGARDPYGVRPLCLGRLKEGWVLASESCALDTVGAEFVRDLEPGEVLIIDADGPRSLFGPKAEHPAHCIFEFVYFARPDSTLDGRTVNIVRREFGRRLALECSLEADLVVPVPDSGTAAATGYAEATGIPFVEGLIKNRYVGRTFIQPTQRLREVGVRLKLNPIRPLLEGKRVILIDDSIVRGTTGRRLVQMLRGVGVKEVYFLVASPPVLYPCYYGIDTSARGELIAAQYSLEKLKSYVGADALHYLSLEGMLAAVGQPPENFCTACFTGNYPIEIPPPGEEGKFSLESGAGEESDHGLDV
ncbi:MAG: amidophosphoribosyltransferase [Clostridia bacterium]|nr:amidophosphoribosyltransferase [Clostridia bacterium]